jgi:uncharacterized protein YggU (UPF0235/DUF167 family)
MYIKVKVIPDAKKEKFEQKSEELFEISVKEPAKRNMANKRVQELIARYFGIMKGEARIISGHRSPIKIISINK